MSRVVVTSGIRLESVNGPLVTTIVGRTVLTNEFGEEVGWEGGRCVYLGSNAVLSGFILTNGLGYRQGGGVLAESSGIVTNCIVSGNAAHGMMGRGGSGGGAFGGALYNCTLTGNSAGSGGGGAFGGALYNCTLTGNSAGSGGGAYSCTLYNCTVTGNSADWGGGAFNSTLQNCTVTDNDGVGVVAFDEPGSAIFNSIVYYNSGGNYTPGAILNYCCTTPLPAGGTGNITADPELASASHLSVFSPCRGAGSAAYAIGTDIDGEAWASPPSIGCDEYHAGAVTGPLSVDIAINYTNVVVGYPVDLTALIEGRTDLSIWDFDDGAVVLDQPYATHTWTAPGDYLVVLRAFNDSHAGGVSASVAVHVAGQRVHYVAAGNANPVSPYTSWATAATNIQDAVDQAPVGGEVVVSDGVYATGGRDGSRVAVTKPLTVRSVNGAQFTVINGDGVRCVYLSGGASLSGFTLTNGTTDDPGGGLLCGSWTAAAANCVVKGNYSGWFGGGVCGGSLYNCVLTGNSCYYGGGACQSALYNCTVTGNSGGYGGGASFSELYNCIVAFNHSDDDPSFANHVDCSLAYSFDGDPRFVSAPAGDYRLLANSPCINAGNNAYVVGTTDAAGNPRIVSGTVDIGAYEFDVLFSVISYAWLQRYGLPTSGSVDFVDSDLDGHNNWQEWRCQTNPTNALSALRLVSAAPAGTNVVVTWQSVAGVNYFLERSTNLWASPPFTPLATGIPGQAGTTTYTDTDATRLGPLFYRVGVAP